MKKKITSLILALSILVSFCNCGLDLGETSGAGTSSSSTKGEETGVQSSEEKDSNEQSSNGQEEVFSCDELSVHFLELGNKYTGDCTLIKVGDTEVLIDAGSRQSSATTIQTYVDKYCTDGVLEYVIATHADQDHIAGLVGTKNGATYNGILYTYEIGTLIQFPKTGKSVVTESGNSTLYGKYLDCVEYAKGRGTAVYTALDCWKGINGAQRSYTLGEGVELSILYQRYYEEESKDENEYSVCTLLTQGDRNFLFTGDLEEKGEASLLIENDLPKCELFKGGHHGSPTSSTEGLLSVIQPKIVCVCCCCGSTEYTTNMENVFPSQAFVDRVAPYTDKVYVTTVISEDGKGFSSMNGNIVVSSNMAGVSVKGSNNDLLFKDTDWFKAYRTLPDAWKN